MPQTPPSFHLISLISMSFFTRFFKQKQEEDYETVLSSLAQDVQQRQIKLSEIRLRERRATLFVTLYTLAGWVAYVSIWYMGFLPNLLGPRRGGKIGKAVTGAPVVVGPVVILFIRRIVQIWYKRKGDAEEKMLQSLRKQQKQKVEEIKKKTNYDSTRKLIQEYEASTNPAIRPLVGVLPQPITPQRPLVQANGHTNPPTPSPLRPPTSAPVATPQLPLPPHKGLFDKFADALLGDDDHTPHASTSRYALICEKCFAHNGLVKASMWEDTQYICPKCNHFNALPNAKKVRQRTPSVSPQPTPSRSSLNGSPRPENVPQARTPPGEANLMEVDDT